MWTYQEILLASNPIIVCGDQHVSWSRFIFGLAFLEYSGAIGQRNYPTITKLKTWVALGLTRDHLPSLQRSTSGSGSSASNSDNANFPALREYISFINTIHKKYRLVTYGVVYGLSSLFLLAVVIAISVLFTIFGSTFGKAATAHKAVENDAKAASSYNSAASTLISGVISVIMASAFNEAATKTTTPAITLTPNIEHAVYVSTPIMQSAKIAQKTDYVTITLPSQSNLGGYVTQFIANSLLIDLNPSWWASLTSDISKAVATVVQNCRSSCSLPTKPGPCFQSCTATNTAMPNLTDFNMVDANTVFHSSRKHYILTVIVLAALLPSPLLYVLVVCCSFGQSDRLCPVTSIGSTREVSRISLVGAELDHTV